MFFSALAWRSDAERGSGRGRRVRSIYTCTSSNVLPNVQQPAIAASGGFATALCFEWRVIEHHAELRGLLFQSQPGPSLVRRRLLLFSIRRVYPAPAKSTAVSRCCCVSRQV
jgi:hypothetical protein